MANRRLLLILLAGLISISMAKPKAGDKNSSSSSEESTENGDPTDEIRALCRNKTGSDETYEKLAANGYAIAPCIVSKFDVESFSNDLDTFGESTRVEFFGKYCPQWHDSLSCLDPAVAELRKCMGQEEVERLDMLVNIIPEAVNLACKDNGQIFFMEDTNLSECAFISYTMQCAKKISNTTEAMELSNYGPKQCDELSQVRQCFVEQLAQCNGSRLIDIFDLFYRPMVKASPCQKQIKLDELPAIESNTI